MANIQRRDNLVNSIARIQAWAKKDGPDASKEEVNEQVAKVKSRWLSFQAENKDVLDSCGPQEALFHVDVKKNTEQVYMETLQLLLDLLRSHAAREASGTDTVAENAAGGNNTHNSDDAVAKSATGASPKQFRQHTHSTNNMDHQRERMQRHSIYKLGIVRLHERCAHIHNSDLASLQTYMDTLEDYWHNYMDNIHTNHIGANINADITETETYYIEAKSAFRGRINNNMATAPVIAQPAPALGARLKLPPIQIGKFDGDFRHWTAFHDLFTKMVHEEASLSGAQKLYYLKQCVQGDAEKLIRSYQISDVNYVEAWNALKARYKSKRQIANSTFKTLFGLTKLATESASTMRAQLDTFLEAVNQ